MRWKYVVSVTMDKDGGPAKAEGMGTANVNGFHADLTVNLDLRSLPQGTYYLATTHEGAGPRTTIRSRCDNPTPAGSRSLGCANHCQIKS